MNISKTIAQISVKETQNSLIFRNSGKKHWGQITFFSLFLIAWVAITYETIAFIIGPNQVSQRSTQIIGTIDFSELWGIYIFLFFVFLAWILFAISRLYSILWQLFGLETIRISKHSISIYRELFRYKTRKVYPIGEINNLRVAPQNNFYTRWHSESHGNFSYGSFTFDFQNKTRRYFGYEIESRKAKKMLYMIKEKFPEYRSLANKAVENQRKKLEIISTLLFLSPVLLFILFIFYQFMLWGPISKRMKEPLQSEYKLIAPYPQAEQKDFHLYSEPARVSLSVAYQSSASSEEIMEHYHYELLKHGWTLSEEYRGYNDTQRTYCSGEYALKGYFYDKSDYGDKYALWMTWGNNGAAGNCPVIAGSLSQLESIINWQFLIIASVSWMILAIISRHSTSALGGIIIFSMGLFGLTLSIYGTFKLVIGA